MLRNGLDHEAAMGGDSAARAIGDHASAAGPRSTIPPLRARAGRVRVQTQDELRGPLSELPVEAIGEGDRGVARPGGAHTLLTAGPLDCAVREVS